MYACAAPIYTKMFLNIFYNEFLYLLERYLIPERDSYWLAGSYKLGP